MTMPRLKTEDICEMKRADSDRWLPALVKLASSNGKSLALECSPLTVNPVTQALEGGVFVHRESGAVVLLLSWVDARQVYCDAVSGMDYEVRSKEVPDGK